MAAILNTTGILTLTASFTDTVSAGIIASTSGGGSLALQSIISIADQLTNAATGAKTCDLMYAKQLTLSGAITTLDFSALPDPNGTNRDWTSGRCRLLIVQVVDTTAGHDVKVYGAATNGVAWLPLAANPDIARTNGGIVLIYDPNSSGAATGNVLSATSKLLDLDPGANTVVVNVLAVGNSTV